MNCKSLYAVLILSFLSLSCGKGNVQLKQSTDDATTTSGGNSLVDPQGVVANCPGGETVFSTNMSARFAIGQPDLISNSVNQGSIPDDDTLSNPIGITMKLGKLYIGDGNNNRVMVYNTRPQSNNIQADLVVGQDDFNSNSASTSASTFNAVQGVGVDDDYLYVAQWTGSRVSVIPLNELKTASAILGQEDYTSDTANNGGVRPDTINTAVDVIVVGNDIIVTDTSNKRVLIYDKTALLTGMDAKVVIGQTLFTTNSAGDLNFPLGIASDGTRLVIVDASGNRILIYNTIPTVSGQSPDVILGSFGTAANQLNNPVGAFIHNGKLFVADRGNDRILIWNTIPTVGTESADVILGQTTAGLGDHNQCNCTTAAANTLWGPHMVYHDGCRLIVSDTQNNRVLIY